MRNVKDPVCGLELPWGDARAVGRHQGKLYYFCCAACWEKFGKSPRYYLNRDNSRH